MLLRWCLCIALGLSLLACGGHKDERPSFSSNDDATELVTLATGFSLRPTRLGYQVEVYLPADTLIFALYRSAPPAGVERAIRIPVQRIAAGSTTHMAMLDTLGMLSNLVGLMEASRLYNPQARARLAAGQLVDIAPAGELNLELLFSIEPELLLITGVYSNVPAGPLAQQRITALPIAEWLEAHPLGRLEWIKLMGALVDKYDESAAIYESVCARYDSLSALAPTDTSNAPMFIVGGPFQDVWYMPAGQSYMAQLLRDAGVRYPFAQDSSQGSLPLSIETVFAYGLTADAWLNPGTVNSLQDLAARDARHTRFPSFQESTVYRANKRRNDKGGDDFWERGVLRPDDVLADIIYIAHPSLLPGYELHYFRPLPLTPERAF